jgi:hypothetical protein
MLKEDGKFSEIDSSVPNKIQDDNAVENNGVKEAS